LFYRKHYPRQARAFLIGRDILKSAFRLLTLSLARSPRANARREEHLGRLRAIGAYFRGLKRI